MDVDLLEPIQEETVPGVPALGWIRDLPLNPPLELLGQLPLHHRPVGCRNLKINLASLMQTVPQHEGPHTKELLAGRQRCLTKDSKPITSRNFLYLSLSALRRRMNASTILAGLLHVWESEEIIQLNY